MCDRIVALVDMDCFYCQVEMRLNPSLKGKPMAVVQYNQWQGGGIIAVNYEAREFGVTRHLRGNDAKQKCPDIVLVPVPSVRDKADLTKYREAGREVVAVFCQFSDCVQRASVDEAYLDLTQAVEKRMQIMNGTAVIPSQLANTYVVGYDSADSNDEGCRSEGMLSWLKNVYHSDFHDETLERLTVAGVIVEEMRAAVYAQTGFRCSAGIAHNKILCKLACGLHKPNRQTILPDAGVAELYRTLPIKKIRSLGGKFGEAVMETLGCKVMADLVHFTEAQLQQHFDEKSGTWLYNIARGIDMDPVTPRLMSKSIGCCKKFPGKQALSSRDCVEKWLFDLATEVSVRLMKELEENKRRATLLTVAYQQNINSRTVSSSRCGPLNSYEPKEMANEALELIKKSNTATADQNCWSPPLKYLGLSVGKFEDKSLKQTSTIHNFFKTATKSEQLEERNLENCSNAVQGRSDLKSRNVSQINLEEIIRDEKISEGTSKCEMREENSFFLTYFRLRREGLSLEESLALTKMRRSDQMSASNRGRLQGSSLSKEEQNIQTGSTIPKKEEKKISVSHSTCSQEPSTSGLNQVHEDSTSNENWISPREIFPDLNEVDDDVLALLPSPMQKQMLSRLQERNEQARTAHSSARSQSRLETERICSIEGTSKDIVSEDHDRTLKEHSAIDDDKCYNASNNNSHSSKNKCRKASDYSCQTESDVEDTPDEMYRQENIHSSVVNNRIEVRADIATGGHEKTDNTNEICSEIENVNDCHAVGSRNPPAKRCIFNEKQKAVNADSNIAYGEIEVAVDSDSNVSRSSFVLPVNTSNLSEDSGAQIHDNSNNKSATFKDRIPTEENKIHKEVCPHCKEEIPLTEYPEHLDFHVATELDKQLNCNATVVAIKAGAPKPSSKDVGKRKRGKPGKTQPAVSKDKKMRSITAFFTSNK